MEVSLVVPLTGGPDQALRCLQAVAALEPDPAHEVVLVDDASVGLEALLACVDGDVQLVRRAQRGGLARALRDGVQAASCARVALLRDAAEPAPDALRHLLAHPQAAAATVGQEGLPAVATHLLSGPRAALLDLPDAPDGLAIAAAVAHLGGVPVEARARVSAPGGRTGAARGHLGSQPEVTIVIPTLDAAGDRARRCIAAVQACTAETPHEVVVVDNGAPPQGFTAPVNAGIRAARGAYVVVLNDDVEVLPGWWPPLRAALDGGASCVFPRTVDGAMREDLAAWCFALARDGLRDFAVAPGEFLDPELVVWYQDTDLLARLRAAGRPPVLVEGSRIRHGLSETVGTTDPELRAWVDAQIRRDKAAYDRRRAAVQAAG